MTSQHDATGPIPATPPALLGADQTTRLLDDVVYEQVLACVDLDALYQLEQSLTLLAGQLDGVDPDHAADLAKAMLDRGLLRLPDDMRRYLRAVDFLACDGCELCEAEARQASRGSGGGHPRRATRLRS
jgi:hypothetical protein